MVNNKNDKLLQRSLSPICAKESPNKQELIELAIEHLARIFLQQCLLKKNSKNDLKVEDI